MLRLRLLLPLLALPFFGTALMASGGPENTIVVVNANSDSSKLIANHYIQLRKIPSVNVIYLNDIPNVVRIPLADFKSKILLPLINQIRIRKINRQIDYIVYSSDFPTQVDIAKLTNDFMAKVAKVIGKKQAESIRNAVRPTASINSLTFFMTRVLADQSSLLDLDSNSYMRKRNSDLLKTPFVGELQEQFQEAVRLGRIRKYDGAIAILTRLSQKHPNQTACHYWLARFHAQNGDNQKAVDALKRAVETGWAYRSFTMSDISLDILANDPDFQTTLNAMPDENYRFLPTTGFRSAFCWGRNGMVNANLNQGESYVLSTVLAVTRNQGLSETEAIAQLSRAVAADGTRPNGTFYFTDTTDVRSTTRKKEFPETIETLKKLGHVGAIVKGRLPTRKTDIAGLTIGTAKFTMTKSKNEFLPGAIGDNFTSFGGALEPDKSQTKLTEFLRTGAAGASGTVDEPMSIANKFPHPNIHCHYVRGCSLAEAYYQSVQSPYQLLIVGDALCQPWATFPEFEIKGVQPHATVSDMLEFELDFSKTQSAAESLELFLDGIRVNQSKSFGKISIDTRNLADGYHELRVVAIGPRPIMTTGRAVLPFQVDNIGLSASISVRENSVDLVKTFSITVKAKAANRIEIRHHRRVLKTVEGDAGNVEIDARELGRGNSQLMAVAVYDDELVRSPPIGVAVTGKLATTPSFAPLVRPTRSK